MYRPAPIDNSHLRLGPEWADTIETLARNLHELRSRRMLAEGWRYGPRHAEADRATPLLVPFDDLPESVRESERENAVETLKTVLALGGSVSAPAARPPDTAGVPDLLESWDAHGGQALTLERHRELGDRANALGECLVACDIADEGLKRWPGDRRLRQIRALALARMGSHEQAREILSELGGESGDDEETAGLLARTYKDLWLKSGDPKDLERACQAYEQAYRQAPERYWTGINAATLAFVKGDREKAGTIASRVRDDCGRMLGDASRGDAYWLTGTIAEASLLAGDFDEAERRYTEASNLAADDFGHLAATWRNVRILTPHLPPEIASRVEAALRMPRVAVFTGHRVDEPGRAQPRFPQAAAGAVGEAIRSRLVALNARVGYASAACGGDILFLEAMQAVGGRTHVVLPCREDQFVQESVAPAGGDWVERFRRVMRAADEILVASDERITVGSVAYEYANEVLHGLATARARQFGTELVRMAVWDGRPAELRGGTAEVASRWQAGGHAVDVIDPLGLAGLPPAAAATGKPPATDAVATPAESAFGSEIRAMIFADAYHFSKLGEAQVPVFIESFLGPVADLLRETQPGPVFRNTWGDGLFFVFERAADAGRFALRLAERIARLDRRAVGLPETIALRIALHVGPVYRFADRIIGQPNFIGSHVNRAARIEPVTPPGLVYGSYAFAALAALETPGEFTCDYVGRIPLAKGFGEFAMYRVQAG